MTLGHPFRLKGLVRLFADFLTVATTPTPLPNSSIPRWSSTRSRLNACVMQTIARMRNGIPGSSGKIRPTRPMTRDRRPMANQQRRMRADLSYIMKFSVELLIRRVYGNAMRVPTPQEAMKALFVNSLKHDQRARGRKFRDSWWLVSPLVGEIDQSLAECPFCPQKGHSARLCATLPGYGP